MSYDPELFPGAKKISEEMQQQVLCEADRILRAHTDQLVKIIDLPLRTGDGALATCALDKCIVIWDAAELTQLKRIVGIFEHRSFYPRLFGSRVTRSTTPSPSDLLVHLLHVILHDTVILETILFALCLHSQGTFAHQFSCRCAPRGCGTSRTRNTCNSC